MVLLRLSTHVVAWTALRAVKAAIHHGMVDTPCKIMVLLRLGVHVVA